jgi:pyrimidine operon attenuation protein/uracil phosphoribosyltransferase
MSEKNQVLTKKEVQQRIKRIAYEILERNFKEKELVLAGIFENGYTFAKILQKELAEICTIETKLIKVTLDKLTPSQSEVSLDVETSTLKNKNILLIDDVLNTGRTTAYALKPFLATRIKSIQTVFMVNRGHHSFPISADFVGYSMATSLKEHIEVDLSAKNMGVYLS